MAALISAKRERQQPADFDVLPENWNAVMLFLDCISQWNTSPNGRVLGLRYDCVDVVIKRGGYEPLCPDDWGRLQTLERVAAHELNR